MLEHGLPIQDWIEGFTAYLFINGHIKIIDNPYNNGLSIEGTAISRLAGADLRKWNMTQRIAVIALKQRLGSEAKPSSLQTPTPTARKSWTSSMTV
jgi:hypothetical protein